MILDETLKQAQLRLHRIITSRQGKKKIIKEGHINTCLISYEYILSWHYRHKPYRTYGYIRSNNPAEF